ncbi:hypothetical protein DPMN_164737 [Dreissena polymorpha]|uniref:Uncharacterized protein n=1 Tax=Dreissena polymorpha TaxID=45954 RepID=A0A9D4EZ33_DREPO|nr:hypothetical protein DPMN_164737 [Dreissena polymorpha]
MYSEMHTKLSAMETCMDVLEDNLEKKLAEKLAKIVDKRVNKLKKGITESVINVRSDIDKEINYLTKNDDLQKLQDNLLTRKDDKKLNLVVHMLPYSTNENLERKVYALFCDGLKLNNFKITSAERKLS